ncbi:MAG: response regulator, partial [Bacteroidota bacterium]
MKVIIIEDEPLMANALKEAIERLNSNIEVVRILSSVREALTYFKDHDLPELFFSDIHLPDGLRFEIFRQLATDL